MADFDECDACCFGLNLYGECRLVFAFMVQSIKNCTFIGSGILSSYVIISRDIMKISGTLTADVEVNCAVITVNDQGSQLKQINKWF